MKHGSVRNNEEPRRKENTAHQSTVKPLTGINSERFELGSKSTFYSFKLFFLGHHLVAWQPMYPQALGRHCVCTKIFPLKSMC